MANHVPVPITRLFGPEEVKIIPFHSFQYSMSKGLSMLLYWACVENTMNLEFMKKF